MNENNHVLSVDDGTILKARILELASISMNPKHEFREFALGKLTAIYEISELLCWHQIERITKLYIDLIDYQNNK